MSILIDNSVLNLGAASGASFGTFLILGLALCLFLGGAVLLLSRRGKSGTTDTASEPIVYSPPAPASSRPAVADQKEDLFSEDFDGDDQDTTAAIDVAAHIALMGKIPAADEGKAKEQAGDFPAAAAVWRARGDFVSELRALTQTENHHRIAELKRALGRGHDAVENYRTILSTSPDHEATRLHLIYALVDAGDYSEAKVLAEVVLAPDAPITVSPHFLPAVAEAFESRGEFETALALYESAGKDEKSAEALAPRIVYIRQILRLARAEAPVGAPEDVIDKALTEDGTDFLKALSSGEVRKLEIAEAPTLVFTPHEVIVGHLALGGNSYEHEQSVRSFASPAARFEPGHIVGERPLTAVIEARDHLIDCPVAIRLTRISTEGDAYDLLRERLRAISHLNHPNVSKITYADRYGNIVRVVNEFHGGGNLKTLVARLNKVGFPLMLRILLQISSGVDEAHRNGILHGDLRAENIMLGHDNMIKIVDFALRPWPVRLEALDRDGAGASQSQELQSDLVQIADIMEYLLENTVIAPHIQQQLNGYDPTEDLRDLIKRAREGGFQSIHFIHRGIHTMLERVVPNSA